MPYPNEHSARLKDPKAFNPDTFRRKNGGTIYGKIKVPKTIAIIWGKLKGKDKPADPVIPQALRFPTKNWTTQKAKKWLKDNDVKYMRFEPAKPKSKQADFESTDPGKNPCIFAQGGPVEFTDGEQGEEKNKLRLKLYDGSVVRHWFWGNLAFELTTMRMRRKTRNPILYSHDTNQRLAYSTSASFDGQFVLEGEFLQKSQKAAEIKQDIAEKFPFEASLRFDIDHSNIIFIKEGESVKVNGHQLKGPGALIKDAMIMEGSVCVFGALKNTKSEIFEKEIEMTEEMAQTEMTAESFATEYPELHSEIVMAAKAEGMAEGVAKGEKEVRDSFAQFAEKFGDDPALCVEQFKAGATIEAATAAQNEKLKKENKEIAEKAAAQAKAPVDPAAQEFSDRQTQGDDEPKPTQTPDEKYGEEFDKSADLQAKFNGNRAAYIAFRKADDEGRVQIAGQRN